MEVAVENKLVKELESGVALLIYDIPYPPRGSDVKKARPWYSWYDWATERLRSLGYPLQYSVILLDESRIEDVKNVLEKIEKRREELNRDGFNIPPPHVNVIKFSVKTRQDAEILLSVVREGLKSVLEAFIDDIRRQLEEGRDRTKLQRRAKNFIKKLQKQDFLQLLLRDNELRSLVLQLEILTA